MYPEAVPIIDQEMKYAPSLVFTNKLAVELRSEPDPGVLRKLGSLGREVIGIARVNDEIGAKLPSSLDKFDKVIIVLGPGVGESWLRYVMGFTNTVVGLTLDSLMRLVRVRPSLLNIPDELFIDPVMGGDIAVQPKALPKAVIDWLMEYVESGGDLYMLVRGGSINSINLLMHSRFVFTYDMKLAELYNGIIKGGLTGNTKVIIKANCDFCGSPSNPLCLLVCPDTDIASEVEVR